MDMFESEYIRCSMVNGSHNVGALPPVTLHSFWEWDPSSTLRSRITPILWAKMFEHFPQTRGLLLQSHFYLKTSVRLWRMILNLQVMLQHAEWWNEGYDGAGGSIRTDRDRKEQIYIPLLPRVISWTVAGTVTLFSPALNRLRHILYKRTVKLDDLVKQANISMPKAIRIFFTVLY